MGSPLEALRIERVIAVARLFLTVIVFVSFNIGSVESASFGLGANALLALFAAHSVSALLVLRIHTRTTERFVLTTHTVDLLAAAITMPMAGPANPFFAFFLFVLAAAAFRWGLRETVVTTGFAIVLVIVYARITASVPILASLGGPRDATIVVVQSAYLAMVGLLVGYLAEAGRLVRAEAAIIVNVLTKVRIDASLTRALNVVADELITVFDASNVLLAVEDLKRRRLFRWDPVHGWSAGPLMAPDEPLSPEQLRYRFGGRTDRSFSIVQQESRSAATPSYRVMALDPAGRPVDASEWKVPAAFAAAHPFKRLISAPVRLGNDWEGRVFVIDPRVGFRLFSLTQFLQTFVQQVGPAVFSVYLLERLRARAGAMERARVARELHDGVIQSLIGIEMHIDALRSSEPLHESPLLGDLTRIQGLVRDEVLNLRDLMQQMRPDEFEPDQFLDHLADMVQRFHRDTGITARFTTDLLDVEMSQRVCFELVRIVQEGLVNVRKHSAATTVAVRFGVRDGFWTLEIKDDGRGFPFEGRLAEADLDARNVGPAIIKERVHSIDGQLVIDSTPGRGARLEVLVPQEVRE